MKLSPPARPSGGKENTGASLAGTTATPPPGASIRAAPDPRSAWSKVVRISASVISPTSLTETSPVTAGSTRKERCNASPSTASAAAAIGARSSVTLIGMRDAGTLRAVDCELDSAGGWLASTRQPWGLSGAGIATVAAESGAAGGGADECGNVGRPLVILGSVAQPPRAASNQSKQPARA